MSDARDVLDLLGVDTEHTFRMPIVMPGEIDPLVDEAGNQAYLEFLPWDSDVGRALDRKTYTDTVRKGFRQRSRAEMLADAEKEDQAQMQAERLTALAKGWHLVGPDKKAIDLPFSTENARRLFESPRMAWLRRQAWTWINNEANFMSSSAKISTSSQGTSSASTGGVTTEAPSGNT